MQLHHETLEIINLSSLQSDISIPHQSKTSVQTTWATCFLIFVSEAKVILQNIFHYFQNNLKEKQCISTKIEQGEDESIHWIGRLFRFLVTGLYALSSYLTEADFLCFSFKVNKIEFPVNHWNWIHFCFCMKHLQCEWLKVDPTSVSTRL